jgi:hypothetical protein
MKNSYPLPAAALAQHIAFLGKTGAGKTTSAKGAIEHIVRSDPNARVCILDAVKSDWWGLTSSADGRHEGLPFYILGGPRGHVPLHQDAGEALGELVGRGSLPLSIIDMADFGPGGLQTFFNDFAPALMKNIRGVLHLVLEEAHEFAPKERAGHAGENMTLYWAKKLATAGRSKGIRLMVCTQRIQQLHNSLLGSCDTMVAHRMTAPADQKPVKDWLKANVDKETFEKVSSSLSSLKTGTAWICSGEANIVEPVQFPLLTTFDNSATPKSGTAEVHVTTARVDREKLRTIIGDAVQEAEANSPATLKAEIAKLRAELAKKPAAETVVDEAAVEAARANGFRDGSIAGMVHEAGVLQGLQELGADAGSALATMAKAFQDALAETSKAQRELASSRTVERPARAFTPSTGGTGDRFYREKPPARQAGPVSGDLSRPQQRILDALAWLEWVGSTGVDRVRVAMLADQSPKSSGFRANLSTLSGRELLTYRGGDGIDLTEAGRAAANKPAGAPTNAQLHDAIRSKISGPQWLMLQALINVYPGSMARDLLAEASSQSPTSSGFRANLSTLSGLGFVEYRRDEGGTVAATSILFVEK